MSSDTLFPQYEDTFGLSAREESVLAFWEAEATAEPL